MANTFNLLISGALTLGYLMAGLFFYRFWRESRDRLFLLFAVAFTILALQRFGLSIDDQHEERRMLLYFLRLAGFLLILAAILDKNRSAKSPPKNSPAAPRSRKNISARPSSRAAKPLRETS